ncbi:PREDICTED: E3 ubiquitin-protein ligase listerin [Papilio polytes]|uniref:E3 ubiquitin-protein ligase listerin n=1 Tax=Papilio polytes TaxID=76194 RepID=UPI000676A346|nr:PREDICTED: E3 ubiquitin-protein ligase listerin [Papilio polytes]
MGGKSKKDRTKNNARPSSSGRSAELLINSTKDPAIFGITSGKLLTPIFSTLAAVNFEDGLNTEYALCFKKFNKKDPITKSKALQELLELTRQSSSEDVVAALPAWAHFYPILSVDTDRKVREYTQVGS